MAPRALILAGGAGPRRPELDGAWPGWDQAVDLVIAADAGALLAAPLGLHLDLLVGDGDSLGPAAVNAFEAAGVTVERSPVDKDASDTELALIAAVERGARELIVVGAFGGRLDHTLANLWLLAHPVLEGRVVSLLDGRTRVRMLSVTGHDRGMKVAGLDLAERPADLVTLLPFDGPATGVTTTGLRWPLADETLPAGSSRGLSNEVLAAPGGPPRVEVRGGRLIVIETTLLRSEA